MGPYSCVRCFGPIRTALCSFTQTFMDGYISVGCCSESFYYVKLVDVSLAKAGHIRQTQIQCGWGLCGGLNDSVHFRATGVVPELALPAIIERLFKTFWVFFFLQKVFHFSLQFLLHTEKSIASAVVIKNLDYIFIYTLSCSKTFQGTTWKQRAKGHLGIFNPTMYRI